MPDIENLLNIEDEVTQVLSDLGVNEKLNEMDDFMNQNDLKVQITNENAVVTGLVTYTCTVKDKNNTALANKVVEWYKGTTLIGIDATDSNGVSTFSHRVTEADIYDVHAIVRGTHAGDDIRMFVKDKNNIIPDNNVWSGTDVLKSVSGFNRLNIISSSTDWSSIGERSFKLTRVTEEYSGYTSEYGFELPTGDYQFTVKVYSPNANGAIRLLIGESDNMAITYTASDTVQTISFTLSDNNIRGIRLSVDTSLQSSYFDDFVIVAQ